MLFGSGKCHTIYNRIRYLVSNKSDITNSIKQSFARIRIDSNNSLPLEKH